jgi:DNA-binding PadR family transcriptional regulator
MKKRLELTRLSITESKILKVLLNKELYSSEILEALNQEKLFLRLGFRDLYPALNRLEKNDLISWRWNNNFNETGIARRKYYKITSTGRVIAEDIKP